MTVPERIRQAISASGPLDDDELATRLHVVRQAVNQAARRLEKQGVLARHPGPSGKIVNALVDAQPVEATPDVHEEPSATSSSTTNIPRADLLLVTCVKEKAATPRPAKDLYTSALFKKERAYAERKGLPWFILSAEHGLVAPDEWLAPYELYLPDTPSSYRAAWSGWVVERLVLLAGDLHGLTVEIHASEEYTALLRPRLADRGAALSEPLTGLRQGERLAWYGRDAGSGSTVERPPLEQLVEVLTDPTGARSPAEVLASGADGWRTPGLYSWWVDDAGADDLSGGLGHRIEPGLVYAGLAGATRWPSGKVSKNTLWTRITGMHLGGNHTMSTLRRTFGSVLAETNGWSSIDEAALTVWMGEHLKVVMVGYEDANGLGHMEKAVLEEIDPPLNLMGMPRTEVRRSLRRLRSFHS